METRVDLKLLPILLLLATPLTLLAERHTLLSTPKTVHWGYYDAAQAPVLRVRSGDTVEIRTAMIDTPEALERAGVAEAQIDQASSEIHRAIKDRGAGPHILTGPVFVDGAEPGDTLEVHIESIRLGLPYAVNVFFPGLGVLPEDFPYEYRKLTPLDETRMVARFAPGVEIPIRPFFGSMGVAPPEGLGRINSAPPWIHAGNLDNKELVAGTTLYIPVHVRGALFSVGDAHAGQGNGEVCLSALETVLSGVFRFTVRKGPRLLWPRPSRRWRVGRGRLRPARELRARRRASGRPPASTPRAARARSRVVRRTTAQFPRRASQTRGPRPLRPRAAATADRARRRVPDMAEA